MRPELRRVPPRQRARARHGARGEARPIVKAMAGADQSPTTGRGENGLAFTLKITLCIISETLREGRLHRQAERGRASWQPPHGAGTTEKPSRWKLVQLVRQLFNGQTVQRHPRDRWRPNAHRTGIQGPRGPQRGGEAESSSSSPHPTWRETKVPSTCGRAHARKRQYPRAVQKPVQSPCGATLGVDMARRAKGAWWGRIKVSRQAIYMAERTAVPPWVGPVQLAGSSAPSGQGTEPEVGQPASEAKAVAALNNELSYAGEKHQRKYSLTC